MDGVKDTEFEIYHGDTLTNDWDILHELNPARKPGFDAIVANPPFSYRWDCPHLIPRFRVGATTSSARRDCELRCAQATKRAFESSKLDRI